VRIALLVCFALLVAAAAMPQQAPGPAAEPPLRGSKVYIEPMEHDLDEHIRSRILKRGLPIILVASPEDADFILSGLSSIENRSRALHWLTLEQRQSKVRRAALGIYHRASGALLWSATYGEDDKKAGIIYRDDTRAIRALYSKLVDELRDEIRRR
jgi:hypothetical protein